MSYNLFIDDIRSPHWPECTNSGLDASLRWLIVRTSDEACMTVRLRGMPDRIALDHDLGLNKKTFKIDIVPNFLNWLAYEYFDPATMKIPEYTIHSANPVGAENMKAFMESWKKSQA